MSDLLKMFGCNVGLQIDFPSIKREEWGSVKFQNVVKGVVAVVERQFQGPHELHQGCDGN